MMLSIVGALGGHDYTGMFSRLHQDLHARYNLNVITCELGHVCCYGHRGDGT